MVKQLLLCKRIFGEGVAFAERSDSVSSGLAISLFQDSVEMYVWALVKEKNIPVKDGAPFMGNLETVQKTGVGLEHVAKLIELNKARVGFKHYGNLPAPDEAGKFQTYVEDFLRTSFQNHFSQDFDDLSLVDLVSDVGVQKRLKEAEKSIATGDFYTAATEAAIAKTMLFTKLDNFFPKVDRNLRDVDSIVNKIPGTRHTRTFQSLTEYLEVVREVTLAALLKLPLQEYTFLRNALPAAFQMMSGEWRTQSYAARQYDETMCKRAVACLVNISIRLESVI